MAGQMAFLTSWETLGSFGEQERERDQAHSGQIESGEEVRVVKGMGSEREIAAGGRAGT